MLSCSNCSMPAAYLSALRVKAFKSVGPEWLEVPLDKGLLCLVGANGSGKSSLLDSICFAAGCTPSAFGVARLADLQNSDSDAVRAMHKMRCVKCSIWQSLLSTAELITDVQVCEVQLALSQGTSITWVTAALTPDGSRSHKINGKLKPAKDVKVSPVAIIVRLLSCFFC